MHEEKRMTIEEMVIEWLTMNGMPDKWARGIVALCKESESFAPVNGHWGDDAEILTVSGTRGAFFDAVTPVMERWLFSNQPATWTRLLFAGYL